MNSTHLVVHFCKTHPVLPLTGRGRAPQQGAALIAALVIIAIVTTIAISLLSQSQLGIQRTSLLVQAEQAALDGSYAIAFANLTYVKQFKRTPSPNQNSAQIPDPNQALPRLPIVMPSAILGKATVDASLSSAQGLFNLNNLSEEKTYLPIAAKLIHLVDPTISEAQSLEIASAIAYFINPKIDPLFEKNYTTLDPPYRPSHQLFADKSELRLVDRINVDLYQKLLPYVTTMPEVTSLNPALAPKLVLVAYGLSEDAANNVSVKQGDNVSAGGIKTMEDFYKLAGLAGGNNVGDSQAPLFDLKTKYFLLTTTLSDPPIHWTSFTLMKASDTSPGLQVLQQTR